MKPSILDEGSVINVDGKSVEIGISPNSVPASEVIKQDSPNKCWEKKGEFGYDELMSLTGDIEGKLKKNAEEIINYIYLFKSNVIVYANYSTKDKLLVLPKVYIAIDLFHKTKEDFLEIYKSEVINSIEHYEYLYSVEEAQMVINSLRLIDNYTSWKNVNNNPWDIKSGEVLASRNGSIGKYRELWMYVLTSLFQSDNNWKSGKSYLDVNVNFELSLLPYHAFCYESNSNFHEDETKKYLIENEEKYSDDDLDRLPRGKGIAIFSLSDSGHITFLGGYELDMVKSKKESRAVFRLITNSLNRLVL